MNSSALDKYKASAMTPLDIIGNLVPHASERRSIALDGKRVSPDRNLVQMTDSLI